MKRILSYLIAVICFTVGISKCIYAQTTGSFTDKRDGEVYKIVEADDKVWMAENLCYKPETGNHWAYNNDSTNVARYGYLYDISSALQMCPTGWHLPSLKEWKDLKKYYGGNKEAGAKMVSKDENSFAALPGGMMINDDFVNLEKYSCWWTDESVQPYTYDLSSALDALAEKKSYWAIYLNFKNNNIRQVQNSRANGASVRCIKDN